MHECRLPFRIKKHGNNKLWYCHGCTKVWTAKLQSGFSDSWWQWEEVVDPIKWLERELDGLTSLDGSARIEGCRQNEGTRAQRVSSIFSQTVR